MKYHLSNASQRFVEFFSQIDCWLRDTIEKLSDIFLDFLTKIIELTLVMMNLIFQVICFVISLCVDTVQTFANVFRGIVNVFSNISCEEIEDFASACIVAMLWIGAFKLLKSLFNRNSRINTFGLFCSADCSADCSANGNASDNNHTCERAKQGTCPRRRRAGKRVNRRYGKRPRVVPKDEEFCY